MRCFIAISSGCCWTGLINVGIDKELVWLAENCYEYEKVFGIPYPWENAWKEYRHKITEAQALSIVREFCAKENRRIRFYKFIGDKCIYEDINGINVKVGSFKLATKSQVDAVSRVYSNTGFTDFYWESKGGIKEIMHVLSRELANDIISTYWNKYKGSKEQKEALYEKRRKIYNQKRSHRRYSYGRSLEWDDMIDYPDALNM